MKEYYAVVVLRYINVVVKDTVNRLLEAVEFVVMRGEDRSGIQYLRISYVLENCPRDRQAVVS